MSRVSSNHQTLEQQTEAVLKEVRKDGYSDDNIIIIEDKESAIKLSEEERNGLNRMKEYIKNDPSINAVYLYELSRLSRRQTMLFTLRDYFIERKIQLITLKPYMKLLDEDGKMSFTASMMFTFFSVFSENEMIQKKERMMRGRRHNVAMGKIGSGRPPFGYAINKEKYYIIDPITSKIVERFFLRYSKGDISIEQIAMEMKEEGLFPNTTVYSLRNKFTDWLVRDYYIGKHPYPQIISKSLFDKVQSVRKKRQIAPKKKIDNRYLLKGLLFDLRSGRMVGVWNAYDCYFLRHPYCSSILIRRKEVDNIVWDYAKQLYRRHIKNPKILIRQLQKELATIGKKADTIRNEISSIVEKIDKAEIRMINGHLSQNRGDEFIEQQKELLSDKERRMTELINETAYKQHQLLEIDMTNNLNEEILTLDEKITIVKRVIKKVTVLRPLKYTAQISIYSNLDDTVAVYEIKTGSRCREKGTHKIEEYHLKEKKTS